MMTDSGRVLRSSAATWRAVGLLAERMRGVQRRDDALLDLGAREPVRQRHELREIHALGCEAALA